ncbi:hypothetical protein F5887DRAFT_898068 [Amanita rubescens]|nr:hypothetical protein F5887DRAFT_898068 [Amanita rubescens]
MGWTVSGPPSGRCELTPQCSQTHLLVDKDRYVIGVLYGWPKKHRGWKKVQKHALKALNKASAYFTRRPTAPHRRGTFPSIAHGISYGGGQPEPRHLSHSEATNGVLNRLLNKKSIQRICSNASHGFMAYGQRNYEYMRATVDAIKTNSPSLKRPYDSHVGVYPCRSFNLGKQSVSYPHVDVLNLAQSWCSITPVGSFDPKMGGHLVLKELGLVVEFPHGSTVLIPSALITHSNTAIRSHETRYSIVQYAAGGLFRWTENGFMNDDEWEKAATVEQVECREEDKKQRWKRALAAFTTLDELLTK